MDRLLVGGGCFGLAPAETAAVAGDQTAERFQATLQFRRVLGLRASMTSAPRAGTKDRAFQTR